MRRRHHNLPKPYWMKAFKAPPAFEFFGTLCFSYLKGNGWVMVSRSLLALSRKMMPQFLAFKRGGNLESCSIDFWRILDSLGWSVCYWCKFKRNQVDTFTISARSGVVCVFGLWSHDPIWGCYCFYNSNANSSVLLQLLAHCRSNKRRFFCD